MTMKVMQAPEVGVLSVGCVKTVYQDASFLLLFYIDHNVICKVEEMGIGPDKTNAMTNNSNRFQGVIKIKG